MAKPPKGTKPKTPKAPKPANDDAGFGGPSGIRVRMYRVGFGDFFLLSLRGDDGAPRHILIDCGVHAANLHSIGAAIEQLAIDTGKRLALVIMTHRHADHISGFGSGKDAFAEFTVERVWAPWFENPDNAAAKAIQSKLTALAGALQAKLALRAGPDDDQLSDMMTNILGAAAAGAAAGNALALDVLHGGFKTKTPVDYYKAGDPPVLPDSLAKAGLKAQILGPPIDETLIAEMDGATHQYLEAVEAAKAGSGPAMAPFAPRFHTGYDAYPARAFALFSPDQLEDRIQAGQPDELAAAAKKADNTINNQSLMVLFTFGGRTLLFAGDAQWGNWQNFLFGGEFGKPGHMALTEAAKTILGELDFYKVGHHGSTNATPVDMVNALRQGCVCMCSTQPGAYGKEKNNSEVPRIPLMEALKKKSGGLLARSDQVAVAEAKALAEPLAEVFRAPTGTLFIDYEL